MNNRRTEEPNSRRLKVPEVQGAFILFLCFFGPLSLAGSQDTVVYSTAADPAARVKKTGTILEFTGSELRLRSTLGTEEAIPAARVVEVQTRWTAAHESGRTARSE